MDDRKLFKYYCSYVFGFTILFTGIVACSVEAHMFELVENIWFFYLSSLAYAAVGDIILIIMTFFKISEISRGLGSDNSSHFQMEKER